MKKRITYLISDIDKALAFDWISEGLDPSRFDLSFVLYNNGPSELEDHLLKKKIVTERIHYRSKKDLLSAIRKTRSFLIRNRTDIVHTHLFDASFIGLTAARIAGVKKRIMTRHYSTLNHEYFPRAVKWDRYLNKTATTIVAISENVRKVLIEKEGVAAEKIQLIHHGFKLELFTKEDTALVRSLTDKYNPNHKAPVIGVISRLIELKGVQYIIPAFAALLQNYPNALLLLFNAKGEDEQKIDYLLTALPPDSYIKTGFEKEIGSLYHLFDVFVHTPVNAEIEAFGQTYVEALASGTPLVATLSGIAPEILNTDNSMIVPFKNSEQIAKVIEYLLTHPKEKKEMVDKGKKDVVEKFNLNLMLKKLESLYLQ